MTEALPRFVKRDRSGVVVELRFVAHSEFDNRDITYFHSFDEPKQLLVLDKATFDATFEPEKVT